MVYERLTLPTCARHFGSSFKVHSAAESEEKIDFLGLRLNDVLTISASYSGFRFRLGVLPFSIFLFSLSWLKQSLIYSSPYVLPPYLQQKLPCSYNGFAFFQPNDASSIMQLTNSSAYCIEKRTAHAREVCAERFAHVC
jgi:hypothetical protein